LEKIKKEYEEREPTDKEINFAKLRKQKTQAELDKEEKEKELEDFKKSQEEKIEGLRKEMSQKELDEDIAKMTDDEEEAKKIKFYFDKLSAGEDASKRKEILTSAYRLAVPEATIPNFLSASGAGSKPTSKKEINPDIISTFASAEFKKSKSK
jgi:hypothetical protein